MTDGTDDRHSAGSPPAVETPSLEIELADEELLAELRTAAGRFDAVPPSVHDAALAAFELRNLDAELAELVADSAVEAGTVLVRGTAEPRLISFASPRISIELQVTAAAGARRLVGQVVGQVVGMPHGVVEVDHRDGVIVVQPDDLGRFVASGVSAGPVRLRCELPTGGSVMTSWLVV